MDRGVDIVVGVEDDAMTGDRGKVGQSRSLFFLEELGGGDSEYYDGYIFTCTSPGMDKIIAPFPSPPTGPHRFDELASFPFLPSR